MFRLTLSQTPTKDTFSVRKKRQKMTQALAGDAQKANAAMQFLYTTLNPIVYNTAPPIETSSRSDILKDVTIQCQFLIPTSTPVGEGIPTISGMILWLMKRGLGSLYRMGLVPNGATSVTTGLSANPTLQGFYINVTRPTATFTGGVVSATAYVTATTNIIKSITYTQELAIPYGVANNGQSAVIQITPNVAEQITFSRVFAGIVETYSSTVSIGNTTLAGTFSAASISDTRDVCQSPQGAFSITNIIQSSETTKDALMQVPSNEGVVTLVGPDIQSTFTNPSQENVIIADGNYTVVAVPISVQNFLFEQPVGTGTQLPLVTESESNATLNYNAAPLGSVWVTPWATVCQTQVNTTNTDGSAFPVYSNQVTTIQTSPVAETGMLRMKVIGQFWLENLAVGLGNTVSDFTPQVEIAVVATHVFATANLSGTIAYSTYIDKQTLYVGNAVQHLTQSSGAGGSSTSVEFDPQLFFQGYTVSGKYIGTLLSFYVAPTGGTATSAAYNHWAFVGVNIANVSIAITAPDIDVDGNVGPARVIRWDGMSPGMQLDVAGKLWAQIIPSSNLMPYVKAQQMNRTRFVPENAERLVLRVYNASGTLLRRVWNLKAYKDFLLGSAKDISQETIMDWARNDVSIAQAANAAGIFSSLGSSVGGFLDSALGASGQFTAPQFGPATARSGFADRRMRLD